MLEVALAARLVHLGFTEVRQLQVCDPILLQHRKHVGQHLFGVDVHRLNYGIINYHDESSYECYKQAAALAEVVIEVFEPTLMSSTASPPHLRQMHG
jgi:hypothetical protein